MEKRFFNIRECADYLGVRASAVTTWSYESKIPSYRILGLFRFDIKEIAEWKEKYKRGEFENNRRKYKIKMDSVPGKSN